MRDRHEMLIKGRDDLIDALRDDNDELRSGNEEVKELVKCLLEQVQRVRDVLGDVGK